MDGDGDTNGFETNSFDETSYQVTDNIAIPIYADVQRYPCPICSRCFNAESLVFKKKRFSFLKFSHRFEFDYSSGNISQSVKILRKNNQENYSIWANNVLQILMFLT